jgi:T-complex protein 1 subunit gamma
MLKMLLDPMGGVVLTNDGNAILREVEVAHPAAKSMIELARTQDEEVGDGTTSVIILGNLLVPSPSTLPLTLFTSSLDPLAENTLRQRLQR